MNLSFRVNGVPAPKGSTRAYVVNGRAVTKQTNEKTRPWQSMVAGEAADKFAGRDVFTGPVSLVVTFYFPRPLGHFGTGRNSGKVKDSAPMYPSVKPDLDKLVRAILDALTGVVYRDDSQVAFIEAGKKWCEPWGYLPGAYVSVEELDKELVH